MRRHILIWAILFCVLGAVLAADNNPAFTNPADAGPDFTFQGEYVGNVGEHRWGAQIVALGDGEFDVVGHRGGLPGEGWKRGDQTSRGTGERKDGLVEIDGDGWTAKIKDGVMTVFHGTQESGQLKKVERKSPTLGAKPPQNAIILFDGDSPDHFENGQIV